jgi:hypothetical protein
MNVEHHARHQSAPQTVQFYLLRFAEYLLAKRLHCQIQPPFSEVLELSSICRICLQIICIPSQATSRKQIEFLSFQILQHTAEVTM